MLEATRGRFLTAASAAAAATAIPRTVRAQGLTPVTIGLIPGDPAAVVAYALQRGFFKSEGLDVTLSVLANGPSVANAVVGGSIDLGGVNTGSLASAVLRGIPLRIVAPGALATAGPSGDVTMVPEGSSIRSGRDFNNKIVGIGAIQSGQHAAFLNWVDNHGGDSKSIKMLEVPFPSEASAMQANRIDAAVLIEPFTTLAADAGMRNLGSVWDTMTLPFMGFAIAASDQWLRSNAETAMRVRVALRQAAIWSNAHQPECRTMLRDFMKLDQRVANTMRLHEFGTTSSPSLLKPIIDLMVKYGFLEKSVPAAQMIWRPEA